MNKFKKATVIALAFIITISMNISTYAKAGWIDYLGFDGKSGHTWYEAADGTVTNVKKTGWTVNLNQIGWGGIWGGQMYRYAYIRKGQKYRLKFKIKSTKVNKWVFVRISTKNNYAYGKWIWLKKNKYKTVDVEFKAKSNANQITFGFGGEYGDREAADGKKHYAYAGGAEIIAAKKDAGGDSGPHDKTFTKLILKNYSLKKVNNKIIKCKICPCNCGCCR